MKPYIFETEDAEICIIEMIGEHNLEHLEKRVQLFKKEIEYSFSYIAIQVDCWNQDLSPWSCLDFGDGAEETYQYLMTIVETRCEQKFILGGYSLAGLFSLWVGFQTDFFDGIVACSPSVWFPRWDDYLEKHSFKANCVYLSLGSKEHKTKHPLMRNVKKRILLTQEKLSCILEINPGNHFQDVDIRMVKGYKAILKEKGE